MKSKRAEQWNEFAKTVEDHIEDYTVPQYGDAPDDQVEHFSAADIKVQLERYVNRIGSNARGEVEAKRDCLKIAHYACLLNLKLGTTKEVS